MQHTEHSYGGLGRKALRNVGHGVYRGMRRNVLDTQNTINAEMC